MVENFRSLADFIWSVADLLRGDFRQSQYGRVILPFTLLRRLECVLEPSKDEVLRTAEQTRGQPEALADKLLLKASGQQFYNTSQLSLGSLSDTQTFDDLARYVQSFSPAARGIFDQFNFDDFLDQLNSADLLYLVVQRFAAIDLHPKAVDNYTMGLVFEELIRKFAESSNDTAGEHFTPRDIVHLTTSLVLTGQEEKLQPGKIIKIYDPTAGTGGFLSEGEEYVKSISTDTRVKLFGQELNPESYAICVGDMLIKDQSVDSIKLGNTLSDDQLAEEHFDFMLSNPPFGVDWKKVQRQVGDEHKLKGHRGRFGPGLPRVSDGSLLFLMHLMSKMQDAKQGGARIGIILNGSPLFTGGAGSGESEIRRHILEQDLLEAIVALPTDMFYNTGIATYIWLLNNHKPPARRGKVQLINATERFGKMRRSLGSKRKLLLDADIEAIVRLYGDFEATEASKLFDTRDFGYRRITVERPLRLNFQASPERLHRIREEKPVQKLPELDQVRLLAACERLDEDRVYRNREAFTKHLKAALKTQELKLGAPALKAVLNALSERDEAADVCLDKQGNPEPDPELRDYENVPLAESVQTYFEREVLPHVPDAWIDQAKRDPKDGEVGVVGYEIPFNRHFYRYEPPRPLEEIDRELKELSGEIQQLLDEVAV
ncbi:type I restriction-modification system subunit M [Alkalilimnicola sp. S0819]|uniref:type I restriction-modification system subunit M n=1 Tax=Alkalilimnicola sp. S0819 TaxID=2613922 RepID=UPI0012617A81|nr:class I SAM-dependent DNA methyltransferase [Alkalilimnicola sp. S0819]KAB7619596.1 SAM-dependent DNA methyltransferase [Alkalilimnicola sp. S0819]MPQ17599.1 N-6 DNA methylase [Alkalilimnicola sp. S0819]